MTKKTLYKLIVILVCYAIAFGIILPWLVSAKSTIAVILGATIIAAITVIPTVNLFYSIIKDNEASTS